MQVNRTDRFSTLLRNSPFSFIWPSLVMLILIVALVIFIYSDMNALLMIIFIIGFLIFCIMGTVEFRLGPKRIISFIIPIVILIISVIGGCPYLMPYPSAQMVGVKTASELKAYVCSGRKYVGGEPCGTKNVQWKPGIGDLALIYVYGVNNESEINYLVELARISRGSTYKKTSIKIKFYSDLKKSELVKDITIKGE